MNLSPEEKSDSIIILENVLNGTADIILDLNDDNLGKLELEHNKSRVFSYEFAKGNEILYIAENKKFRTSFDSLRKFSALFLDRIGIYEGNILEKNFVELSIGALETMLRSEEFIVGALDPSKFFKERYRRIQAVYKKFKDELEEFPIELFNEKDYLIPKENLENCKKMLEVLAEKFKGETLAINNMRKMTTGFRRINTNFLLFEPLNKYYTEDKRSKNFKEQLKKYSK